jgi:hypothetical protein
METTFDNFVDSTPVDHKCKRKSIIVVSCEIVIVFGLSTLTVNAYTGYGDDQLSSNVYLSATGLEQHP